MAEQAPPDRLSGDEIAELGLDDWRSINLKLRTRFRTGDFATGVRLVSAIGEAADAANHHPDVDLRYGYVDVALTSHDVHAKTQRDVDLARQISEIAADLDISAEPNVVQELHIALDTSDMAEIRPFWMAVLGVEASPRFDDELVDPTGQVPTIWFQETDPHDPPRQRFHLDLRVPPEVAEERIAAALKAGGRLVSDAKAPRFTVLADPQGNHVCVCTHIGRPD